MGVYESLRTDARADSCKETLHALARRPSKGRAIESLRGGTGAQKAPAWRVAVGRGRRTTVLACAVPLSEMPLSLVGRMSAIRPIRQETGAGSK